MILISTHLDEALYELATIDGPARIVISNSGFRALPGA